MTNKPRTCLEMRNAQKCPGTDHPSRWQIDTSCQTAGSHHDFEYTLVASFRDDVSLLDCKPCMMEGDTAKDDLREGGLKPTG